MTSPLSYVVQAQGLPDREKLLVHLAIVKPTTITVLDDFGLCVQIKNLLPDCIVIYRDFNFEPQPDYSMLAFAGYLANLPDKRIVLLVNNEQGFNADRVNLWVRMMTTASAEGWRLCLANVSSGSVKCGQGNDPNDWQNAGAPLLRAFVSHPEHYLGFHDYSMPFPWAVSNGAFGTSDNPPALLDWRAPQWHIGRNVQGITNACKTLGIAPPKCIVTEGVIDTMNDIVDHFGTKADGYKTLSAKWAEWYPGKDRGDILANMHEWAWEKAYAPCGFVLGLQVFCYGDASGKWANYRVDNEPKYLARMESYHSAPVPMPPPIVVQPPPVVTPPPIINTSEIIVKLSQAQSLIADALNLIRKL